MSGEVNILRISHSPSPQSQVTETDVAFTVINDEPSSKSGGKTPILNNKRPPKPTNLNNRQSEPRKSFTKKGIDLNDSMDFVNSLDAKLKDLEDGRKKNKKSQMNRPMFITTVKTGIFLDPPPELAALLGYPRSYNESSGSSQKSSEGLMYSFSSQPRVLNNRNKIAPKVNNDKQQLKNNIRTKRESGPTRKPEDPSPSNVPYGNIMFDRRVVRGPAFMHHPVPTVGMDSQAARQAEARRRAMARRKAQTTRARNLRIKLGTPPPVDGRKHEDIQTEEYLEELFEHPPAESVFTQTDYFLDRPKSPKYVPSKVGIDQSTQIYPGELFHFDLEVKPILEVLVGKTIEQALVEVMEEEELAAIREQQRRFKEIRDSEKAEEGRLEEEEIRMRREMELRVLEQEDAVNNQRATEDRIAAAVLTTGYIANLLPSVMKDLNNAGFLYDDIKREVDDKFMPWLMKEVKTEMQKMVENRDLLTEILREIIETRAEIYHALGEKEEPWRGTSEEPPEDELPEGLDFALEEEEMKEEDALVEEEVGEEEGLIEEELIKPR